MFADDRRRRTVVQAKVPAGRTVLLAVNLSDKYVAEPNRKIEQYARRHGKHFAAAEAVADSGRGTGMYLYCTRRRGVGTSGRTEGNAAHHAESTGRIQTAAAKTAACRREEIAATDEETGEGRPRG